MSSLTRVRNSESLFQSENEIVTNCKVGGQTITLIKTAADFHTDKIV